MGIDDGDYRYDPDALSLHPERLLGPADAGESEDGPLDPRTWFVEASDLFAQGYCVSLVQGVDVDDVFGRMGAEPEPDHRPRSFEDVVEDAYDLADETDFDRQLVGAAVAGGWTVIIEPNGTTCARRKLQRRLSAGTTVVTLYSNFNGANELTVTTDGVVQLTFDRDSPADRSGKRAAAYDADLLAAGFLFDPAAAEAADDDGLRTQVAGAVLVERLTGVRLDHGFFDGLLWDTAQLRT